MLTAVVLGQSSTAFATAEDEPDGPPGGVILHFEGNQVFPGEVYKTVLELAATATTAPSEPPGSKEFVERQITQFLRKSGYLLATVTASADDERGGLVVQIDEGRLDRIIVVGQGVVRTLQTQVNLNLPQNVFNRFVLERQLAALVRDRGLDEATYQVVPMEQVVDHLGIQLTHDTLLGANIGISPGAPHELLIRLDQPEWRLGIAPGIGFQSPDGFHVAGTYRTASLFKDDDRWFTELQVAFRSFEALFSSNDNVGFSRGAAINRWYGPPLLDGLLRPTIELDLRLQSRFRGDLSINRYFFAPLSATLQLSVEPLRGLTIKAGGGVQFRKLFEVDPEPDTVLLVRTEEQTMRGFGEVSAIWNLEPDKLRQDRQQTIEVSALYFTGGGSQFDGFGRLHGTYDKMFNIGYDELWFELDGVLLLGDVPFYDEVALGDGFVRLGYGGDFFMRKAAAISTEYRLSIRKETFKISLFNDAAVFQELRDDRSVVGLEFSDSVGVGLHFLVLNTFQVNTYVGVGFVPSRPALPGVSLQVTQAF